MKYFRRDEFTCSESGDEYMDDSFLAELDKLRGICNFGFYVNSGYRNPMHSVEKRKLKGPGVHTMGIAADIRIENGSQRYSIISNALEHGFTGIGVAKSFVHLDMRRTTPVIWSYS